MSLAKPLLATLLTLTVGSAQAQVTKYVRYAAAGKTSYGILEGDTIRELATSAAT